jgi:formylmethanofuran dehydrogenase subunit E
MGILDEYKLQFAKDKENEDKMFPNDSKLDESQRSEYEKCLNDLRNNPNSIENVYHKKMSEMKQMSESEMMEQSLIKNEDVEKVIIKHAYCSECGEELISKAPPMFNPFTFERICKHTCEKCGAVYNLDFAYPRVAFINNNGDEINAFGC